MFEFGLAVVLGLIGLFIGQSVGAATTGFGMAATFHAHYRSMCRVQNRSLGCGKKMAFHVILFFGHVAK